MTIACPYCGSDDLVEDQVTGDLICKSCGTVLDKLATWDYSDYLRSSSLNSKFTSKRLEKLIKRATKREKSIVGKFAMSNIAILEEKKIKKIEMGLSEIVPRNIEVLIENEMELIAYDLITRLHLLRTAFERAVLAHALVHGKNTTVRKLGGTALANEYVSKILRKVGYQNLNKLKILLENKLFT
ncbi:MAG: TFIIB-type zinc ribbon-containing protein [Thermoprotei archaeon]